MPPPVAPDPLQLLCWPPAPPSACLDRVQSGVTARLVQVVVASADEARQRLARPDLDLDLALIAPGLIPDPDDLRELAARLPVLLQPPTDPAGDADAGAGLAAVELGVQDLLSADDWSSSGLVVRLHAAVVRHRIAREARLAYATDLATGLPHEQQLLEHMSHLLALREREPAPMALLVLRIEGLATTEARLGGAAAAALRRKLAVRLRSGLRASDVVASLGPDSFAVLLAWIDAAADVDGVADKLVRAVQRPFNLQGQTAALAVSVGIARYPEQGKDARTLLQVATGLAMELPARGRSGHANAVERGIGPAANDDTG